MDTTKKRLSELPDPVRTWEIVDPELGLLRGMRPPVPWEEFGEWKGVGPHPFEGEYRGFLNDVGIKKARWNALTDTQRANVRAAWAQTVMVRRAVGMMIEPDQAEIGDELLAQRAETFIERVAQMHAGHEREKGGFYRDFHRTVWLLRGNDLLEPVEVVLRKYVERHPEMDSEPATACVQEINALLRPVAPGGELVGGADLTKLTERNTRRIAA